MKLYRYFLCVILLIASGSCKKDQFEFFNGNARIQFGPDESQIYNPSYNLADTTKMMTFFYQPDSIMRDTVFFDIYAIGGISASDRSFRIVQDDVAGVTNAVPGVHYLSFDNSEAIKNFVIRAGTVHTLVPIILLRDASLKNSTVVLKFQVVPSKDFQSGENKNLWRKVIFTDMVSKPAAWDAEVTRLYLGQYSFAKHNFMIKSTGQKWDQDFIVSIRPEYALLQYWLGVLKINLVNYNNEHPGEPLKDENGQLVTFP